MCKMKKNYAAKIVCMVLALVMVAACFAACGETKENNGGTTADGTWYFGATGPLTGSAAQYGNSVKEGAQLAVDEINAAGGINGINYSFDYGNAHFAVLNTNDLLSMSDAQLNWLRNDMNSTSADWKIAFMHKSPYTLGKDGKWPDALYLLQSLTKVLDDCGVDLVMSGHDHMYLRTKSLTNNTVVDDGEGVAYVLAGTAGTKRYQIREFSVNTYMKKDFIAAMTVQRNGYANYWNGKDYNSTDPANVGGCFSTVSIDGGSLTLNAYVLSDETQTLKKIDSFSLSKDTGKNVPTFEGDNSTSSFEYGVNIVPSFLNLAKYAIFNWLVRTIIYLPKIIYYIIKDGTF